MFPVFADYMRSNGYKKINLVYDHDDTSFRDEDEEIHGEITSNMMNFVWYIIHTGIRVGEPQNHMDVLNNISVKLLRVSCDKFIIDMKVW